MRRILQYSRLILLATGIAALSSCSDQPPMSPAETTLKLLALHGLLGKNPSERSPEEKNTLVNSDELKSLFVDLDRFDKFTGELYVGIILGALARNQSQLVENRQKTTAEIIAGKATIHLDRVENVWKINLNKTIPQPMKEQAQKEKIRYEAAKSAAEATTASP
ncbi:MAG: hypothetical protein JXR76_15490 [Deltaproteobacteria bacterium]|nr:hypothetical protein [Deltaproteobacteria bacterium]